LRAGITAPATRPVADHISWTPARGGNPSINARSYPMNLHLSIGPLVALIAGILILIVPRLLNYIIAIYLIVIGLVGLFGRGNFQL